MAAIDVSDRAEMRGNVRALRRGLEVLFEVNRSGAARAGEIAKRIGIARPTVYRLLGTLEEMGYVTRSSSDNRFRVTSLAAGLGDGARADTLLANIAGPILVELSRRFVWPFDLSTYQDAAMVIQETTHSRSPMSIDRGMIGQRIPILRTSSGRIYLASCRKAEQAVILRHLTHLNDPEDRQYLEPSNLRKMLSESVKQGYGTRRHGEFKPQTSSIAVAIRDGAMVLGCLSVIWISNAVDFDDAVREFLPPLLEAAKNLSSKYSTERSFERKGVVPLPGTAG